MSESIPLRIRNLTVENRGEKGINKEFSLCNKIDDIKCKVNITGINVYLRRLVDKGILKVQRRGEYVVCDKVLWEYMQRKSQKSQIKG